VPNIRILNWNIQQLSAAKLAIPGMATAIARTIVALNPDVAVILEVRHANAAASMQELAEELNAAAGGGTAYQTWQLSERTGLEHYAFFIRDTALVRPMQFTPNPVAPVAAGLGTRANPIANLEWARWQTWPVGIAWGAAVLAGQAPPAPLVTRFSHPRLERAPKRRRASFSGRSIEEGGYALGVGSRLPCLAVFQVHTGAGDYYFPIVTCHYAAVPDGRNQLAQGQIKQLRELHIAQLFFPASGFLHINGGPIQVQELIFTGDFNVDFRQNLPGGDNLQTTNRQAMNALTPTQQMGGSAGPAAAPGAPGAPPPFGPPWSPEPEKGTVPNQQLRAAVTWQKTIFQPCPPGPQPPPAPAPPPLVPPANRDAARTAAFDNFFYGGTQGAQVVAGVIPPGPPGPPPPPANPDSGQVDDLTLRIAPPPPPALGAGQVDVSEPAFEYGHVHGASWAPNLQVPGAALTLTDQWIGATLISDHVPVVLEIPCP
jgi:hypothetical protein